MQSRICNYVINFNWRKIKGHIKILLKDAFKIKGHIKNMTANSNCPDCKTQQDADAFDSFKPNKEEYDLFLSVLNVYCTQFKTEDVTIYQFKRMFGDRIISKCRVNI